MINSINITKHLIGNEANVKDALLKLNNLGSDAILFVTDKSNKLIGSLTDGDIRRGLLGGLDLNQKAIAFIQPNPIFIRKNNVDLEAIKNYREKNYKILPVLNDDGIIVNVLNLRKIKSYLPIDAVIFAGGEGRRLLPLTEKTPKPLLLVGEKPIIEHNIDRMLLFGIDDFWITIKYLGGQIKDYLGDGLNKNIQINYVEESQALGTIGALASIHNFKHEVVLVANSDLLTTIDYEDFYKCFIDSKADFAVASIPYKVTVPYAVLETYQGFVKEFKEKPTYTYYSNAGIYFMKKNVIDLIPENSFFNATDLMQKIIENGGLVYNYDLRSYWLDIGKHDDYLRAQEDIKHIKLD